MNSFELKTPEFWYDLPQGFDTTRIKWSASTDYYDLYHVMYDFNKNELSNIFCEKCQNYKTWLGSNKIEYLLKYITINGGSSLVDMNIGPRMKVLLQISITIPNDHHAMLAKLIFG